jgi:hypothetical protein
MNSNPKTVSKLLGDSQATLSEMEQELRSIYQNSIQKDTRGRQALLRLGLYHLDEFTLALTKLSGEEVNTKTEQSSSI